MGGREGVLNYFFQGFGSPFVDAPQGFLFQGGDAAGDVARRRVGPADILPGPDSFGLPPVDQIQNLLADFRGARPAGQYVLGADQFGGFRQDYGPARLQQKVASCPNGRIRTETGGVIGIS